MPKLPSFVSGFMAALLDGMEQGKRMPVFNSAVDEAISKFSFQLCALKVAMILRQSMKLRDI